MRKATQVNDAHPQFCGFSQVRGRPGRSTYFFGLAYESDIIA